MCFGLLEGETRAASDRIARLLFDILRNWESSMKVRTIGVRSSLKRFCVQHKRNCVIVVFVVRIDCILGWKIIERQWNVA